MGIIGDVISAAEVESKILRLKSCKADLLDDNNAISIYNKAIDRVITDVQSLLGKRASSNIVNKLNSYSEPNQGSDGNLINARDYIQREINYLKGQSSGGGGSW